MKVNSPNNTGKTEGQVDNQGVTTYKELKVLNPPTTPQNVANKAYVDKVAITDKYLVGDVMIRPISTTPTGFLKCNGGEVSKTTYSALYAAIGDAHSVYSVPGTGVPWRNQYGINSVLDIPMTASDWTSGNNLSASNMNFQIAVTANRVYIFGRNNNTTSSSSTNYTATFAADGSIGTWGTSSVALPAGLTRSQLFTYLGKLFLIGGNNTSNQSYVWRAVINADGTIGSFSALTTLPFTVANHQIALIQNKLYIIGGTQANTASAAVYCTTIDANGNLGTWTNASNNTAILNLPVALINHIVTVINRRIYVIGGLVNGSTATAVVYYTEFDDAGNMSAWTQSTAFPETVYSGSVITTNEKVYVLGGIMSGSYSKKIYYATIRADGSLGTWTSGGTLPDTIANAQVIVTNGRIYILGGYKGGVGALSTTYYVELPGGLNDYSPYYNGTIGITPSDKFKLPDYTKSDNKLYYFIKY